MAVRLAAIGVCDIIPAMTYYGGDNSGEDTPGYQKPGYPPPGGQCGPGSADFPPPQHYAYPPLAPAPVSGTNGLAIAALIVSLVSCGPVGLVLGIVSLNQIKASGEQGRGMALAGVIIGALSTLFWMAAIILWVVAINSVATFDPYYNY